MESPPPKRRRWFRFSLRTAFGGLTLLGIFLYWVNTQVKWKYDRGVALEPMTDVSHIDPEKDDGSRTWYSTVGSSSNTKGPPWSISILGGTAMRLIVIPKDTPSHRRAELQSLFPEAEIRIRQ